METRVLKAELQSLGVRIPARILTGANPRKGGAGPAEGLVLFFGAAQAIVPSGSPYVLSSPYSVSAENGGLWLLRNGEKIYPVLIPALSGYYSKKTLDGIPYSHIALIHGRDCIASTVLQSCVYWSAGRACRFCGIGLSLQRKMTILRKTPGQLAEVTEAAVREGVRHVTLTSGSGPGAADHLLACARAITGRTGLPIQVQHMPPRGQDSIEMLSAMKAAGVSTMAINIECPDVTVLRAVSPHKAKWGLDGYRTAWRDAVEVFGRNQVISFILAGLGESDSSILECVGEMAALGVYPYLIAHRPIPGTHLGSLTPPSPDRMMRLYEGCSAIIEKHGLSWRSILAGCGRCDVCSGLPDFEGTSLQCVIAESEEEKLRCFDVRKKVFVQEQGLFERSDIDRKDPRSVHIAAVREGGIVGTVRVHDEGNGIWWGSRLAVLPEHRGDVGRHLVKKAEEIVRGRGGRQLLALIQTQTVDFFVKCGWRKKSSEHTMYLGRPHVLMEAFSDGTAGEAHALGRIRTVKVPR